MYRWSISATTCSAVLVLALSPSIGNASAVGGIAAKAPGTASAGTPAIKPAATPAATPAKSPPRDSVVFELLAESGIEHTLERLLASMHDAGLDGARLGARSAPDADARVALVTGALGRAFDMERLRPIVARHVAAAIDDGEAETLLAHHRSALGRRLRAAALTRQPSVDPEGYARFVAEFGSRADDAERLAVLERYARESGAVELVARFIVETRLTSLHTLLALAGESARPFFDAGVAAALADLEPTRDALAERLPSLLAYSYDEFSTGELRTMVAVELSAAGRRMTSGAFDGFREVVVAGSADLVTRVRAATPFAELQDEI